MLAKACGCYGERPSDVGSFQQSVAAALEADRPTLIAVAENDGWLI
jgi:thiamine pyrophosphate-dependent acetolactate synthase large subunit-like protein